MKLDFALILTVLSAATGIVWLVDSLLFRKSRALMVKDGEEVPEPAIVDYSRSLFPVLFAVLVLRSFLAEPFRIPSESMMPNLLVGDFILVNKFDYGLRLPVLNTKFVERGEPKRGDVVVFRYPGHSDSDPEKGTDYIKRVIGLPGDDVTLAGGHVWVNGELLSEPYIADSDPDCYVSAHVQDGHYFVLGDNRPRSSDSREFGQVPMDYVRGRVGVRLWPFSRIGTVR